MSTYPRPAIVFFFNDTATTEIYTLSLHDALPIYPQGMCLDCDGLGSRYTFDTDLLIPDQIGRAHVWNSSHSQISYAVFCLKKKKDGYTEVLPRTRTGHQPNPATLLRSQPVLLPTI